VERSATPEKCKEVEDENDDEDEHDSGSGVGELRPAIAGMVCVKAVDQSGQHCYNTGEHFLTGFLLASCYSQIVVVLVLGLWFCTERWDALPRDPPQHIRW
jgi:hypothetical protein